MLALLSDNYMESKVCQEEYNLARSLNDDPQYHTELMEIKLSAVDKWPVCCTPVRLFDLSEGADVNGLICEVMTAMKCKMDGGKCLYILVNHCCYRISLQISYNFAVGYFASV